METKSKDNQQDDIIQVVDAKSLLQEYIGTGIGGLGFVVSFFMIFSEPAIGIIGVIFLGPITYCMWKYIIPTKKGGYIIDVKGDTFTFPGGRAADEVEDYFNIEWILQYIQFKPAVVNLSDITRISWEDERKRTWNKQLRKFVESESHSISIEGTFGTIRNYMSRGKRDQLYSMLQQTLKMGEPIVINE